jgi:hypothetical protein
MLDRKLLGAAAFAAAIAAGGVAGAMFAPTASFAVQEDDGTSTTTGDEATAAEDGEGRCDGPRRHHPFIGPILSTVAEALDMEVDELRDALAEGDTSIAEVAEDQGKDVQDVIDALVAKGAERIDARVEDGDITEERAQELKDELAERVAQLVEREGPPFFEHPRGHHGRSGPR